MSATSDQLPLELPVLVGAGRGEPEMLLLIARPAAGRVRVRRWSAADWSAAPAGATEDAEALTRWLEAQAASGRRVNHSLYAVRLWLSGRADRLP